MTILYRIQRGVEVMLKMRKALWAIRGLHNSGTPQVVVLARALEKSVSNTQTKAEQDRFDSRESERQTTYWSSMISIGLTG
jgi:hypothetical protein